MPRAKSQEPRANVGFTLTELLIVVGIISVLVTIGSLSGLQIMRRAQAARITSDLRKIEGAWNVWRADTHHPFPKQSEYPNNPPGYCDDEPLMGNTNLYTNIRLDDEFILNPQWRGPYLSSVLTDPWGRQYRYDNDEDPAGVFIFLTYPAAAAGVYQPLRNIIDLTIDGSLDSTSGKFRWWGGGACEGFVYHISPGPMTY